MVEYWLDYDDPLRHRSLCKRCLDGENILGLRLLLVQGVSPIKVNILVTLLRRPLGTRQLFGAFILIQIIVTVGKSQSLPDRPRRSAGWSPFDPDLNRSRRSNQARTCSPLHPSGWRASFCRSSWQWLRGWAELVSHLVGRQDRSSCKQQRSHRIFSAESLPRRISGNFQFGIGGVVVIFGELIEPSPKRVWSDGIGLFLRRISHKHIDGSRRRDPPKYRSRRDRRSPASSARTLVRETSSPVADGRQNDSARNGIAILRGKRGSWALLENEHGFFACFHTTPAVRQRKNASSDICDERRGSDLSRMVRSDGVLEDLQMNRQIFLRILADRADARSELFVRRLFMFVCSVSSVA